MCEVAHVTIYHTAYGKYPYVTSHLSNQLVNSDSQETYITTMRRRSWSPEFRTGGLSVYVTIGE